MNTIIKDKCLFKSLVYPINIIDEKVQVWMFGRNCEEPLRENYQTNWSAILQEKGGIPEMDIGLYL